MVFRGTFYYPPSPPPTPPPPVHLCSTSTLTSCSRRCTESSGRFLFPTRSAPFLRRISRSSAENRYHRRRHNLATKSKGQTKQKPSQHDRWIVIGIKPAAGRIPAIKWKVCCFALSSGGGVVGRLWSIRAAGRRRRWWGWAPAPNGAKVKGDGRAQNSPHRRRRRASIRQADADAVAITAECLLTRTWPKPNPHARPLP